MQTKCAAFWHHTNIRSDNKIFPCCRFKTPVGEFNGNVQEILFTKEYDSLREQSTLGNPISGCEKCYYEESLGTESLREKFNKEHDTDSISLEFLEVGFDNICNLTCDGCWGDFSSSWAKKTDPTVIHIRSTVDFKNIPNTLNKVLFLGGEPLMTTRHSKFLAALENKQDVDVIYNTNGTFLLNDNTLVLLEQFKHVKFILSIDGVGELNDKVRSGSNWSDILSFIHQIKTAGYELVIHSVVHMNNWQGFTKLDAFISEQLLPWTINVLTYPKHLDVNNLTDKADYITVMSGIHSPNKQYLLDHVNQHKLLSVNDYVYPTKFAELTKLLIQCTANDISPYLRLSSEYDDEVGFFEVVPDPNAVVSLRSIGLYERGVVTNDEISNIFGPVQELLKSMPGVERAAIVQIDPHSVLPTHTDNMRAPAYSASSAYNVFMGIDVPSQDSNLLGIKIDNTVINHACGDTIIFNAQIPHSAWNYTDKPWLSILLFIENNSFKNSGNVVNGDEIS